MTTSAGRRPAALTAVLALLGGLLALGPAATPAAAEIVLKPLKVVLIGDSYAAGNGARGADGDRNYEGPADCYRSPTNWASQYVDWLETQGHQVTFVNRACSGGVIPNYTTRRSMGDTIVLVPTIGSQADMERAALNGPCRSPFVGDEYYEAAYVSTGLAGSIIRCSRFMEPQINAVGLDTDLVLVTGGGNDVNFAEIVKQCFAPFYRDPGGCRDKVEEARALFEDVDDSLIDFLAQVRARTRPDTKVGVVGYPYLANDDDFQLVSRLLFWETDRYAAAREVRALGRQGDDVQRAAVDAANAAAGAPFVTYVDRVKAHFTGHEPEPELFDGNPDRWINEIEHLVLVENFHYNPEGHRQLALLLREYGTFGAAGIGLPASGDIDLAFVIDTTGSMGGDIAAVQASANQILDRLDAGTRSYRVAVVDYRDFPQRTGEPRDYAARVALPFSSDPVAIRAAIDGLTLGYGGDTPETMWSGLKAAIDLGWRPGVKKVAVQFGDAPALDPEPISGLTRQDIIDGAMAVDPVAVYGVDTGASGSAIRAVAAATGGEVLLAPSPSQVADRIAAIVDTAVGAPYAWVGTGYAGRTGQPVAFDASGSYDADGTIVSWAWDFDGDGVTDVASADGARVAHAYTAAYSGLVTLRLTDDDGGVAIATAPVDVSADGDGIDDAADTCPDVHDPGQHDDDGDGTGDLCDPDWVLPTEDAPGIGVAIGDPPTATILGGPYSGAAGAAIPVAGAVSDPAGDAVTATWLPADACTVADVHALSTTVTCTAAGTHVLRLLADDGNGGVVAAETTVRIGTGGWVVDAFGPPLGRPPGMVSAEAGRVLPVAWHVATEDGTPVTDAAHFVAVTAQPVSCADGTALGPAAEAGSPAGLRHRGAGSWLYPWAVPEELAGTCQLVTLVLADGVVDGRQALLELT